MPADPCIYLSPLLQEMAKHWPQNRTINIVCHGHSIPSGYFATPYVNTLDAYPHQVLHGIKERFPFTVINVITTSIGGETSEPGAARFENDVLCHKPDVLTIDYALNDRRIGLERADRAWRSMLELCLKKEIKVILLTATHAQFALRMGDTAYEQERSAHSAQVRALADEYGVGLADSDAAFQRYIQAGGHLFDLLSHINHPNRLGHELVAREILRYFPAN